MQLVERPLFPSVFGLFMPLLAAFGTASLIGISDIFLAGRIGPQAQAAVGLGDQIIFLSVILGTGLATANSSFVSRALGAGKMDEARTLVTASLLIAAFSGLLATACGILAAPFLVGLFDAGIEVTSQAVPYVELCSLADIPYMLLLSLASTMRACGKAQGAFWLWFATSAATVGLSFTFFYFLPHAQGRLTAIALGWVFGALAGLLVGFGCMLLYSREMLSLKAHERVNGMLIPLLLTAAPAMLSELFLVGSNVLVLRAISGSANATDLQAAWTVKMKIEQLAAIVPLWALSFSCEVLVGHHTGAGLVEKARGIATCLTGWGAAGCIVVAAILWLMAPVFAREFTQGPVQHRALIDLLNSGLVVLPATAVVMIVGASLDGKGNTTASMMVNGLLGFCRVGLTILFMSITSDGSQGLVWSGYVSSATGAGIAWIVYRRYFCSPARFDVRP